MTERQRRERPLRSCSQAVADGVLTLTLNRPDVLNAITPGLSTSSPRPSATPRRDRRPCRHHHRSRTRLLQRSGPSRRRRRWRARRRRDPSRSLRARRARDQVDGPAGHRRRQRRCRRRGLLARAGVRPPRRRRVGHVRTGLRAHRVDPRPGQHVLPPRLVGPARAAELQCSARRSTRAGRSTSGSSIASCPMPSSRLSPSSSLASGRGPARSV